MFGKRFIYEDGRMARTIHRVPWQYQAAKNLQDNVWELYSTKENFSLNDELAEKLIKTYSEKMRKAISPIEGNHFYQVKGFINRGIRIEVLDEISFLRK